MKRFLTLAASLATCMFAQIYNAADGRTPLVLEPGSPGGVYQLSDLEAVNLMNGQVSVAVPLLRVGGRGEVGYTITTPITRTPWTVDISTNTDACALSESNCIKYGFSAGAQPQWANPFYQAGYGPGLFVYKRAGGNLTKCGIGFNKYLATFSYLVFVRPDGTELGLYSTRAPADSRSSTCVSTLDSDRGTEFLSRDGSGARFTATGNLGTFSDVDNPAWLANGSDIAHSVTGYLMTKDGIRYDVADGVVTQMRDRQGNAISFQYYPPILVGGRTLRFNLVQRITDPLGRQIWFEYDFAEGGSIFDRIHYRGANGGERIIRVKKGFAHQKLRSDVSAQANTALFPSLDASYTSTTAFLDVIHEIRLANDQKFDFQFNPYGELARMTLPSGGAIEYDYGQGLDNPLNKPGVYADGLVMDRLQGYSVQLSDTADPPAPPWRPFIYRRLKERRTYANGGTGLLSTDYTTYPRSENVTTTSTYVPLSRINYVQVSFTGAFQVVRGGENVTGTVASTHSFYTTPRYSYGYTAANWGPATDFLLQYSVRGVPDPFEGKEYQTQLAGLRQVDTVFALVPGGNGVAQPCQVNTTLLDSGQFSTNLFQYDVMENLTDTFAFDFGASLTIQTDTANGGLDTYRKCPVTIPGGWKRRNQTLYKADTIYVNVPVHLRSLPATVATYSNGSSAADSTITYTYDSPTAAPLSDIHQHILPSGATPRGNATSISTTVTTLAAALPPPAATDQTATISVNKTYDIAGNVLTIQDGRAKTTSFGYTDQFSTSTTLDSTLSSAKTYAHVTSIRPPGRTVGEAMTLSYDYYLGRPTQGKDANGTLTDLAYTGDLLDRLKQVTVASNVADAKRVMNFEYVDTANALSVTTRAGQYAENDQRMVTVAKYDGLGREVERRGGVAEAVIQETQYDGFGRTRMVANPRTVGSTAAWTVTDYDVLDRPVKVTYPDNTFAVTQYNGAATTVADAQVTGQVGVNSRSLIKDALGRLTQVVESPANGPITTAYEYDGLDNLKKVTQDASNPRIREFWYDSAKRLRRAKNPETDSIYFAYDNNGNLTQKKHGTLTVDYTYDDLNRMTDRTYTGVATAAVKQCWDGRTYTGGNCTTAAVAGQLDRLSSVGTTASAGDYGFDLAGRLTSSKQKTLGAPAAELPVIYSYYRSGALATMVYPSLRAVTNCYDDLGRVQWLSSQKNAAACMAGGVPAAGEQAYVSVAKYWPNGAMKEIKLGNGLWESTALDALMRPLEMRLGNSSTAGDVWKLVNAYQASGNVKQQDLTLPGVAGAVVTAYGYDRLNRLAVAAERPTVATSPACPDAGSQWCQGFGYDNFGNRVIAAGQSGAAGFVPVGFDGKNQISTAGFVYGDGRGNLTANGAGQSFTYDGENRVISMTGIGGPLTAVYDGEGRRVKKVAGTETIYYAFDAAGQVIAEYSTNATQNGVQYLTADHLGSTRVVTDADKSTVGRYDYLPFGESVTVSPGNARMGVAGYSPAAVSRLMFTGKERDGDSGLDYFGARYMSAAQGRFTSPDAPFADQHVADPQSWNLYSYVRNNPLASVDPTGRKLQVAGNEEQRKRRLEAIRQTVGEEAAKRLELSQEDESGNYHVNIGCNSGPSTGVCRSKRWTYVESITYKLFVRPSCS